MRFRTLLFSLAVAGAIGVACLGPTQIQLDVRTDLDCTNTGSWKGVAIYTGAPGLDVETKAPNLATQACGSGGEIGSLVIVPSGSKDDEVGIRVVAGITRPPEECASADYQGCIVARRTIRFSPHQSLDVLVNLASDCVGLACDVDHTCVEGVCSDTNTGTSVDAGAPTVRCGDNGARCPTSGQLCCLQIDQEAGTTTGDCRDPKDCPPERVVLQCDDENDCQGRDELGRPSVCCLSCTTPPGEILAIPNQVFGATCLSYAQCTPAPNLFPIEVCQDRTGCLDHTVKCDSLGPGMPGYFGCNIAIVPDAGP